MAREWVCSGVRPEIIQEAEEKRAAWAAAAAEAAASGDIEEARERVAKQAQKQGLSYVAEARMQEAINEACNGTRLPAPPVKTMKWQVIHPRGVAYRSAPDPAARDPRKPARCGDIVIGVELGEFIQIEEDLFVPKNAPDGTAILAQIGKAGTDSKPGTPATGSRPGTRPGSSASGPPPEVASQLRLLKVRRQSPTQDTG